MASAFAPSASPIPSPQIDSLQPIAASPQISRTTVPNNQSIGSPGPTNTQFGTGLLSTSPSARSATSSPSLSHLRQIPPFSPNPNSRLSTASLSFTLSQRDSYIPQFPSSLSYTNVRDFAYPNLHPLHYGPQPGLDTPASNRNSQYIETSGNGAGWFSGNSYGFGGSSSQRRLSDPAYPSFGTEESSGGWSGNWGSSHSRKASGGAGRSNQIPPLQFADGPPWNEDPDLHSPVVISTKHRKHKSSAAHMQTSQSYSRRPSKNAVTADYHDADGTGSNWKDDGTGQHNAGDFAIGEPGGEFHNAGSSSAYYTGDQEHGDTTNSAFAHGNHTGSTDQDFYSDIDEEDEVYSEDGDDIDDGDPSRLSNQYFITIASPAEEMHGKAVALFDFQKENENELALVEGQVIWVSYRHGMGWLVAEDPKTRESGLVPEEYVRLLRDIQQPIYVEGVEDDDEDGTSDQLRLDTTTPGSPQQVTYSSGMKPVVSTFSTSSQDVHPYSGPLHQPGEQAPPRNRGGLSSQTQTPTIGTWEDRIEALDRARQRALMDEDLGGYKGRSGSVGSMGDETPRVGTGGGWNSQRRGSAGSDEGEGPWGTRGRKDVGLGLLDENDEVMEGVVEPLNGDAAVLSEATLEPTKDVKGKGKAKEYDTNHSSEQLSSASLPQDLGIDFVGSR